MEGLKQMNLKDLMDNYVLWVAVASWLLAQFLKVFFYALRYRTFSLERLLGAGGMPSSHSAVTCSVLLTSYYLYGFNHPVFALAFVLALIVMYDATGVRWAAGLHARAINHIVEYLEASDDEASRKALHDLIPRLNESLGHRVREVICGAALGFGIAFVAHFLRTPS